MNIQWLGHACFRIEANRSGSVITDPYSPESGFPRGNINARIVTISHTDPAHSSAAAISGQPRIISGPGEYEVGDVFIMGVATFRDNERGAARGKNTVFVIEVEGVIVCHLGGLGHVLTSQQVEEIDKVDVLLLPVGGVSTIDAPMAAQVMRQLEPKIVIPMHYQTPAPADAHLEPVDRFLKEVGIKEPVPQPKLTVSKNSLPEIMQVVVLEYPR